uniref:RNA-dependent RNA polymerase n=1 Tax=Salvia miltiorrhiza TaxID=226208 RepID=W8P325_SALMI|nr:RNA-dependent RNA polymerase 5 [Salvia miltiorrhiza]
MEAKKQKMDGSSHEDVRLPESVEAAIERIAVEKQQPPLPRNSDVRKMLREIGEQPSLKLLNIIHSSKTPIKSFGGFVSKLVRTYYPNQAAAIPSPYKSPPPTIYSPSSISPNVARNGESLQSSLSNLQGTGFQNISCQLSFEDEALESRNESMAISPQLLTLNKLEFRKLFLLLSYANGQKLEDVLTTEEANQVYANKALPMPEFERLIWDKFGYRYCNGLDRSQHLDWDSGKTHIYNCHVNPDGSYSFKGPYLNSSRTHLQRSLGDDNVLTVKFLAKEIYPARKIVEEGLIVGLRRYRFFVFKDEQKKAKKNQAEDNKSSHSAVKCYFVHLDSISSNDHEEDYVLFRKSVSEARRLFMHIHTLSTIEKYMARLSLILSKTTRIDLDFAAIIVEIIEDIPFQDDNGSIIRDEDGKPILHTDGTGYISQDLAMKCSKDFYASMHNTNSTFEPLLIQCRLFHDGYAVKGTLLVNRKLEPGRIQIRPSMIKVEKDHSMESEEILKFNSLEINTISRRPNRNFLSKYLISLLSYGGVPQEFFLNLLFKALEETQNVYSNRRVALRVASHHDDWDLGLMAQRMICCGIPLDEPYLQHCLSKLESSQKKKLKEGRIPVDESCYLMGTADPTGVLHNDEVCVILDSGQISGKVLVYRNPGMHFGDIHVMEAVYVKGLEEFIGNAKYGIFFSTKGQRSAAYEIATGDFDGDTYWVSRNPELLTFFKASEPWKRVYPAPDAEKRDPRKFSSSELERELFQLFLDSRTPSYNMGTAADSWLTYMDRLLTLGDDRAAEKNSLKTKMIKLVDIYYDALDAPKSGKKINVPDDLKAELFPHHMEKAIEKSYHSSSILGQIYDNVLEFNSDAVSRKGEFSFKSIIELMTSRNLEIAMLYHFNPQRLCHQVER